MSASDIVHVLAIDEILKISLIDGGDTLALQLRDTSGDEIAILASTKIAVALEESIRSILSMAYQRPGPLQRGGNDNCRQARCSVIGDASILDTHLIFEA